MSGERVARTQAATAASPRAVEVAGAARRDGEPVVRDGAAGIAAQLVLHPLGDPLEDQRRGGRAGALCASRSSAVAHQSSSSRRSRWFSSDALRQRGVEQFRGRAEDLAEIQRLPEADEQVDLIARGQAPRRGRSQAPRARRPGRRIRALPVPLEVGAGDDERGRIRPCGLPARRRRPRRSRLRSRRRCTASRALASAGGSAADAAGPQTPPAAA